MADEKGPDGQQADKLRKALTDLGFIEVLEAIETETQVRLLFRVHDDGPWLQIATSLLLEEARSTLWKAHLCKQYVLRKNGTARLAYVWNLVLQGGQLDRAADDICRIFEIIGMHLAHVPTDVVSTRQAENPDVRVQAYRQSRKKRRRRRSPNDGLVVGGQVIEVPLGVSAHRNAPKAVFGGSDPRQKGAHYIPE